MIEVPKKEISGEIIVISVRTMLCSSLTYQHFGLRVPAADAGHVAAAGGGGVDAGHGFPGIDQGEDFRDWRTPLQ